MYSDLDAPPPPSQFRRPWSPETYVPQPSSSQQFNALQRGYYGLQEEQQYQYPQAHGTSTNRQQRREASDVSVEALDLADYARTLRTRQAEDPYPPFPSAIRPQAHYPPSSFPPVLGRSSRESGPPSLVSPGASLSSNGTHYTSSSSTPSRARRAGRRPFSLPATPRPSLQGSSSRQRLDNARGGPYIVDPDARPDEEIDISNFPKWSRGWYNSNSSRAGHPSRFGANPEPDADIYTQLPAPHLDSSKKKSPFDPGYVHDPYTTNTYNSSDPYNPYDLPPPLSSMGHGSRDVLPWSNDPPEYGAPLDPMLKEERMRMLEREFGSKAKDKGKGNGKALVDEDGKPLVGTVDEKGSLVTSAPKRRVTARLLQIVLAAGACIPAIYAAVAIKAKNTNDPPPPANKPPVFVLYILSSMTLLLLLYMFCVRPCCCVRSKKRSNHPLGAAANMGMMVLPVGNAAGGKKNKKAKGKKHKKYGPGAGSGDVQVNLIVDPNAFHPPDASDDSEEEEEDGYDSLDGSMPGGYDSKRKNRAKRARRRRRGVFEGLAMEEEWRAARSWAKKVAMVDVAGLVLWGAEFVFIMTGKRCPSGGYEGWCTAYNVSAASACLLAVVFGVTTFFDVQDLHASKQSPRTRT